MQARSNVVLWLLVLGMLVSGGVAVKVQIDKRKLMAEYRQALTQAQLDRETLSQELNAVRQTVDTQASDLTQLQQELARLQTSLKHTEDELAQLRTEQANLRLANEQLAREKSTLEAKLSSVKQLKLAIWDLRKKVWRQHWQAFAEALRSDRPISDTMLAHGNAGYVVRNGVPTLGAVTKLQVRVLDPETR